MKKILRKSASVFCLIAVLLSVGVASLSQETEAYSTGTVKTWETAVDTLTMTGNKGITGSQGGGSYTEDPRNEGHGTVYRLHAVSSPSLQVGRDRNAVKENVDAFLMEPGVRYRLSFDYMWAKGSQMPQWSSSDTSAYCEIALVWGSQLNGGTNARTKFYDGFNWFELDDSNSTVTTFDGKTVRVLNEDSPWMSCSGTFTTAGNLWDDSYTSLMIQNNCNNSDYNFSEVKNSTLYIDNIKVEKLTTVSAADKQQVVWETVVENLNMESSTGISGSQGKLEYVNDPRNEGHGTVYKQFADSSHSFQIGKDNNAKTENTDAFSMEPDVTYKLEFDYMWGSGSVSVADSSGFGWHDIGLVWGTQLNGGSNSPRTKFISGLAYYKLDDSNSTLTTVGGKPARVQTEPSPWYHFEYTFTTSNDYYPDKWRDDYVTLMIQNDCDNSQNGGAVINKADLFVDNVTVSRATHITKTEAQALKGDVNLDGSVNNKDAVYLLYNSIYPASYPVKAPCDFNNDTAVNSSDAVYLVYNILFGDTQYPIKGKADGINLVSSDINYLDADGSVVYRVVYPSSNALSANTLASSVASSMTSRFGQTVSYYSDSTDGTNAFEVLIGGTNRAESKQALDYLTLSGGGRTNDYIICTIGNKIVINATTQSALSEAVSYYKNHYLRKSGNVGGILYMHKTAPDYVGGLINGVPLSRFQIVSTKVAVSYITLREIDELKTDALQATGYTVNSFDDTVAQSEYEIIVGQTNRPGTNTSLISDKYSVRIKGNKVYLEGGNAHTVSIAVAEFNRMLSEGNLTNSDSVTGRYAEAVARHDTSEKYTLTWADDFNYDESGLNGISYDKWYVAGKNEYTGGVRDGRLSIRSRDPDVTYVKDGMLHINAKYDEKYYHGAMLTTADTMNFKYGYVEMKARLPQGNGFWVALWTVSNDSNGSMYMPEIDMVEMFGNSVAFWSNIHGWQKDENVTFEDTYGVGSASEKYALWNSKYDHWHYNADESGYWVEDYYGSGELLNDKMHTYGCLVTPEKIEFSVDGKVFWAVDLTTAPAIMTEMMDCYQSLRLSQATCFAEGSGRPMADDDPQWKLGNNFEVDYVHLYQLKDGIQKLHIGSDPLPVD